MKKKASNKKLRRGAHKGTRPVRVPNNPPGWAAVPASISTLPPGLGPAMGATPDPADRASKKKNRIIAQVRRTSNGIPGGPSPYQAFGGTSIWKASAQFSPGAVKVLKRTSTRRKRKGK